MDRVRLGRALGYGTRHAAKTVAAVIEAAAAPDPRQGASRGNSLADPPRRSIPRAALNARVPENLGNTARAVWRPLAVFSGALWLRVTGLFFAMIAVTVGGGTWRMRGVLHAGSPAGAHRFWLFVGLTGVFAYFAVSSFVRANLKERRAAASPR